MRRKRRSSPRIALPESGTAGHLTDAAGEKHGIIVKGTEDEDLRLDLTVLGTPVTDGDATLEYACGRGTVTLSGALFGAAGDLRFRAASETVEQLREFARIQIVRKVTVTTADGREFDTFAVDLSGGGMLLSGPATLQVGSRIAFSLELGPDEDPIEGQAEVVREVDGSRRGVKFVQVSDSARERVIRFVFESQRIERALTRGGRY